MSYEDINRIIELMVKKNLPKLDLQTEERVYKITYPVPPSLNFYFDVRPEAQK